MDDPQLPAGLRYRLKSLFPPRLVLRLLKRLNLHLSEIVPSLLYLKGVALFCRILCVAIGLVSTSCSSSSKKRLLTAWTTFPWSVSGKFKTSFLYFVPS